MTRRFTVFVDTNPAFTPDTKLAVASANRLIVPFTADAFGLKGLDDTIGCIYGSELNDQLLRLRGRTSFSYSLCTADLMCPPIAVLVANMVDPPKTSAEATQKQVHSYGNKQQREELSYVQSTIRDLYLRRATTEALGPPTVPSVFCCRNMRTVTPLSAKFGAPMSTDWTQVAHIRDLVPDVYDTGHVYNETYFIARYLRETE
jgi:hypothetical protein